MEGLNKDLKLICNFGPHDWEFATALPAVQLDLHISGDVIEQVNLRDDADYYCSFLHFISSIC